MPRYTLVLLLYIILFLPQVGCCNSGRLKIEGDIQPDWLGIRLIDVKYGLASFDESCELLENTIRQTIADSEAKGGGRANAKKIEFHATKQKDGTKSLELKGVTIGELLEQFGKTWEVQLVVKGHSIDIK